MGESVDITLGDIYRFSMVTWWVFFTEDCLGTSGFLFLRYDANLLMYANIAKLQMVIREFVIFVD